MGKSQGTYKGKRTVVQEREGERELNITFTKMSPSLEPNLDFFSPSLS
jgi:hypothetical protein